MRLIDATRLVKLALLERDKIPLSVKERYGFGTESPNHHGQSMRGGIRKILRLIEQAPTIDAVPVVRCGECEWNDVCKKALFYLGKNGFCSKGKRMDGDPHDDSGR